jgi:hypothetical protein
MGFAILRKRAMSEQRKHGIRTPNQDAAFDAEEALKSNLILEAQLMRARHQLNGAAAKMAHAAEIEERLSELCEAEGLMEKAWVHRFSAVCCWAQAGNFHTAISLGDQLLACTDLPDRLRQRIDDYTQSLRGRRAQWSAGLVVAAAEK